MNRRDFLISSTLLAGTSAIAAGQVPPATRPASRPAELQFASAPLLSNPSPTGVTVTCAVTAPCTGWVEYGPTEALGHRADAPSDGLMPYNDRLLSIRIEGLRPGQVCFYRVHAAEIDFRTAYKIVRGKEIQSEIRSFRTLDPQAAEASFTVWNDTHENAATVKALSESLQKSPTSFLMWNGDVTNDLNFEDRIVGQFISPAGQAFAETVPMFLGRGNHDVRGRFARLLPQYLTGPGGKYYHTFTHGPLAVLVMDTGEDKPDDAPVYAGLNNFAAYRTQQRAWLEKAIEDPAFRAAKFRVAFLHIPLVWETDVPENWPGVWGKGIKGWICEDGFAKWHDLLVKGGIDLVISGHTHRPAWFPPNDKRPYGQLIGGGPKPEQATHIVGQVGPRRMEVTMKNLAGEVLQKIEFPARA